MSKVIDQKELLKRANLASNIWQRIPLYRNPDPLDYQISAHYWQLFLKYSRLAQSNEERYQELSGSTGGEGKARNFTEAPEMDREDGLPSGFGYKAQQ